MAASQDLPDWQVWQDRWNSLSQVMMGMTHRFSEPGSRKPTLLCLVNCLRAFAGSQFYFFGNSFKACALKGQPHPLQSEPDSVKYPAEYVFTAILDQVASDLEVIQRAADQRAYASKARDALDKADMFARQILQPMPLETDKWVKNKTTVMTYFQKSASIRVIPYAPVALIGIPFTCTPAASANDQKIVERECLTIPHEIGHYAFWRGKVEKYLFSVGLDFVSELDRREVPTKLREQFQRHGITLTLQPRVEVKQAGSYWIVADADKKYLIRSENQTLNVYVEKCIRETFHASLNPLETPKWALRWLEEIFADVYGSKSAGPVMALSCQEMQLAYAGKSFVKDDGEHPVPALRPLIYHKALAKAGTRDVDMENNWKETVQKRLGSLEVQFTPTKPAGDQPTSITIEPNVTINLAVAEEMNAIIDVIYPLLSSVQGSSAASADAFALGVEQATNAPEDVEQDNSAMAGLWHNWVQQFGLTPSSSITQPGLQDDALKGQIYDEVKGILYETWRDVLAARGWATRGPKTTWP